MTKDDGYRNGALTVIAILLALLCLSILFRDGSETMLVSSAYAQPQANDANWVFFPVGNQEVRRLVIWDKSTNTIYDYDNHGNLENIWEITAPGKKIKKL